MEHMTNISDVKKAIKESVTIYLAKDKDGNTYCLRINRDRFFF